MSLDPLVLSREEVRSVDRRAIDEFGMSGLVLMENAGRGCVETLLKLGVSGPVVIACGRGNNAGDGFVIARHLDSLGHAVRVLLWSPADQFTGDAGANLQILQKAHVPISIFPTLEAWKAQRDELLTGADWIVDALFGTGSRGAPRSPLDSVIDDLNNASAKNLAIDLPSGLDCDTGAAAIRTFRADHTCTFVALKPGLLEPSAVPYVGRVHVIDIGVPRKLLAVFRA